MPRRDAVAIAMPLHFSGDIELCRFLEAEFWDIGPYRQPEFVKTAHQVFHAARVQFGDYRCMDLTLWEH